MLNLPLFVKKSVITAILIIAAVVVAAGAAVVVRRLYLGIPLWLPELGTNDEIPLLEQYEKQGRPDDAARLAADWLKAHNIERHNIDVFYQQVAVTYLKKASKDNAHKDDLIRKAILYYDKDLSVHEMQTGDIELYLVGLGLESAGDLSTSDACLYYQRSMKSFEDELPFIQGDSFTMYGKTVQLAAVRAENDKTLQRVKAKSASRGCK